MLTNQKSVELLNFLESPFSDDLDLTLKGFISLKNNKRILKDYVDQLKEVEQSYKKKSKEIEEYDKKKIELLTPYLEKDEQGNFVYDKNGLVNRVKGSDKTSDEIISKSIKEIIEKLNEEYKEPINQYNKKMEEWAKFFLTEPAKVVLEKIPSNEFVMHNSKMLRKSTFEALLCMIDIDEPKQEKKEDKKEGE